MMSGASTIEFQIDALYQRFGGRTPSGSEGRAIETLPTDPGAHAFRLQRAGVAATLHVSENFPQVPPTMMWCGTSVAVPLRLSSTFNNGEFVADFSDRCLQAIANLMARSGAHLSFAPVALIGEAAGTVEPDVLANSDNAAALVAQSSMQRKMDVSLQQALSRVESCASSNLTARENLEQSAGEVMRLQQAAAALRAQCESKKNRLAALDSDRAVKLFGETLRSADTQSTDAMELMHREVPDDEDTAAADLVRSRKRVHHAKLLLRAHKAQLH